MKLALSLAAMLLATRFFGWAGGQNENTEAARARDFDNHGAE
jgi:hypothetical protein